MGEGMGEEESTAICALAAPAAAAKEEEEGQSSDHEVQACRPKRTRRKKKSSDCAFFAPVKPSSAAAADVPSDRPKRTRKSTVDINTYSESDSEDDRVGNKTKRKRAKSSGKMKDDDMEAPANGIKQSSGSSDEDANSEVPANGTTNGIKQNSGSSDEHENNGSNIQKRRRTKQNSSKEEKRVLLKGENALMCHQCQRNDKGRVVHCTLCKTKRFCVPCMTHWYPHLSEKEIAEKCPVCCNNCNCKGCLRKNKTELLPKIELSREDEVKYGKRIIKYLYPWLLKEFHEEQKSERELEARFKGLDTRELKVPNAECKEDERMYCNKCLTSIVDFHRTCRNCAYDLCLACCDELRKCHQPNGNVATFNGSEAVRDDELAMLSGEVMSGVKEEVQVGKEAAFNGELALPGQVPVSGGEGAITNDKMTMLFTKEALPDDEAELPGGSNVVPNSEEVMCAIGPDLWIPQADGQIPCPPEKLGGCGSSVLELQSVLGEDFVSQLLQQVTEIVSTEPFIEENSINCECECASGSGKQNSRKAANRKKTGDNFMYCPLAREITRGELDHFQKHWMKGEPVIVRDVLEMTSGLSWEPMVMWRALRETRDKDQVERLAVAAVDCRDWTFTEINTHHFFTGYENGLSHKDNWPMLLKLKDWPPESSFDERLPRHGIEFMAALPFKQYTDPRCGPLNLAVKLPAQMLKADLGPKTYIAYGIREELIEGDSVTKLHCDMSDAINILTHTSEVKLNPDQWKAVEKKINKHNNINSDIEDCKTNGSDKPKEKEAIGKNRNRKAKISSDNSEIEEYGGALWDIWRREDVPELIKYLKKYSREFTHYNNKPVEQVDHPIHDQSFYLTMDHKRRLKEEYGIEPWTFEQKLGEAVFIPAGCPHQVRNLKSCIKVALDFVSPENFSQCIELSNQFRLLPEGHGAKEDKLEVKKMAIYALKKAVADIEGKSSDVENEKKATTDIRKQSRKRQSRGTKRRGRRKVKKVKESGKEKTTEIDQADDEMKEETEDGNSSELEKHNKKEMTIDKGGALEENGTGNGHNEDETIKSSGEKEHKTQIKPKKRGRPFKTVKQKSKDLGETGTIKQCERSKTKVEVSETEGKGSISDKEDHGGNHPKENVTIEIGSITKKASDGKDKSNQEAMDDKDTQKEDVPNEGPSCGISIVLGKPEKAKDVDAETEEQVPPVKRKRGRPPKNAKISASKKDTERNSQDQKNSAEKATQEKSEEASKAATEETSKEPCSNRVEDERESPSSENQS